MILTLVEHREGEPLAHSLQALALARGVAAQLGCALAAVAFGGSSDALSAALAVHGVTRLYAVTVEGETLYAPRARARAIIEIVYDETAKVVVASATDRGNEVLAHVAAIAGLPMVANCLHVTVEGGFSLSRTRWAGSVIEDATLAANGPVVFSVATDVMEAKPSGSPAEVDVRPRLFVPEPPDLVGQVLEIVSTSADGVSLPEARVVIGGGRGVGGAEGFAALEEVASLIGAAVGVSRAVTSLGWRPHKDQIGQTGTRIAPELYIACGISGAIQHMVGCKGARFILAINNDPEAPILSKADYAVVGDLHEVLPAIAEEIRRLTTG